MNKRTPVRSRDFWPQALYSLYLNDCDCLPSRLSLYSCAHAHAHHPHYHQLLAVDMVSLEAIRASNARISSELPAGLVAVFLGATSGIGATSLKQFAKRARQPRIYFAGRREDEGNRIVTELKTLNPDGVYHYIKCDASLLKNVDQLCREIKSKESAINLLFLTIGTLVTGKRKCFAPVCQESVVPSDC